MLALDFHRFFAYAVEMPRDLTPVEVLTILAERMEKRANCLDAVGLEDFTVTVLELRKFAGMAWKACEYVRKKSTG